MPTYEGYDVNGSESDDIIYAIGEWYTIGANYTVRGNGGNDKIYAPYKGLGVYPEGIQTILGGSGDDSIYMRSSNYQPWRGLTIDGGIGFDRLFLKDTWTGPFNYSESSITGIEYINFAHDLAMKIGDLIEADGSNKATLVAAGNADALTVALDNRTSIDLTKFIVRNFDVDTGKIMIGDSFSAKAQSVVGSRYSDVYLTNNGMDAKVYGGKGNDELRGAGLMSGGDGDDILSYTNAQSPADGFIMRGGEGNDRLSWGEGTKGFVDGGNGNDTYFGTWTSDISVMERAGGGTDTVISSTNFTLPEHVENLVLSGSVALRGYGNAAGNVISNSTTHGVLIDGKEGSDTLSGYQYDSDAFVFSTALGPNNVDTINGFGGAENQFDKRDKIALDDMIFTGLTVGDLSAAAFYSGAAAHDADDRIIFDPTTHTAYYDPDGTGVAEQIAFAKVYGGLITAKEFVVI